MHWPQTAPRAVRPEKGGFALPDASAEGWGGGTLADESSHYRIFLRVNLAGDPCLGIAALDAAVVSPVF